MKAKYIIPDAEEEARAKNAKHAKGKSYSRFCPFSPLKGISDSLSEHPQGMPACSRGLSERHTPGTVPTTLFTPEGWQLSRERQTRAFLRPLRGRTDYVPNRGYRCARPPATGCEPSGFLGFRILSSSAKSWMLQSIALIYALLVCVSQVRADIKMPHIFGDNMVLQQGIEAPVWGKAAPGEKVTVSVAGQSVSAVADASGKWKLKLQPLKVGGAPLTMTVTGRNAISFKNVLVGEVWLGSGQSNMGYSLAGVRDGRKEIEAAQYPSLRLFNVKLLAWRDPLDDVAGEWVECSSKTTGNFSAVLYFFGRDLQKGIQQPVGLINSSWGGTIIQLWMRLKVLLSDPDTKVKVEKQLKELDDPEYRMKTYAAGVAKRKAEADQAIAQGKKPDRRVATWPGDDFNYRPAAVYNGMIHPILGFPIRGVVWYQGEFNAGNPPLYERLFPMMIQDWRAQWGQGEFPFLFVQLPNHGAMQTAPPAGDKVDSWASLREAQLKTLKVPNTGMAVTIDTSDGDLHPKNKQPVGDRLARLALNLVYGKQTACFGPMFEKMSIQGKTIRLKFQHSEGGLITKDNGPLQGFAIAGADKKFVWGDARVEGDCVLVSNAQVPSPVAVRYGWGGNPVISLYNQAGLPASPFRTDDWK